MLVLRKKAMGQADSSFALEETISTSYSRGKASLRPFLPKLSIASAAEGHRGAVWGHSAGWGLAAEPGCASGPHVTC